MTIICIPQKGAKSKSLGDNLIHSDLVSINNYAQPSPQCISVN